MMDNPALKCLYIKHHNFVQFLQIGQICAEINAYRCGNLFSISFCTCMFLSQFVLILQASAKKNSTNFNFTIQYYLRRSSNLVIYFGHVGNVPRAAPVLFLNLANFKADGLLLTYFTLATPSLTVVYSIVPS